jgi:hypothetical protein
MKKKWAHLVIVVLALLCFAPSTYADISLGGGIAYPLKGTHSRGGDTSFDSGMLISAHGDVPIYDDWLSFGLMFNYAKLGMTTRKDTDNERKTNLDIYVLAPYLAVRYQWDKVKPFAFGGVGGMYADGPEYKSVDGPCFILGGGMGYEISEGLDLEGSVSWVRGIGNRISDTQYIAPMVSLKYIF